MLREATFQDIDAMAELRAAEWGSVAYWRDRIRGYMAGTHHPSGVLVVALEEDGLLGFAAGHLTHGHGCEGELQWINLAKNAGARVCPRTSCAGWRLGSASTAPRGSTFYLRQGARPLNAHWLVWENIAHARDQHP